MQQNFYNKQLVLVGGGHANVQVLKKLCMNEYRGLNVILISENYGAIYSGMTPGFIQNSFSLEEISIDLQRLCFNASAVFIKDSVYKLDRNNKIIYLKQHPSISYDILSINTGSISDNENIKFKKNKNLIAVKPISNLIKKLNYIDEKIKHSKKKKINIIGGGVAAFEISFALDMRYKGEAIISIISKRQLTENNLNKNFVKKIIEITKRKNIKIISNDVKEIYNSKVILDNNKTLYGDINFYSPGASLTQWLKKSKLKLINKFIGVNNHLQSLNDENIFITGDAANVLGCQRSKSGVMAVRQGEILRENIFLKFKNKTLKIFKPQKNWLYLVGTHRNSALLNFYNFSLQGNVVWSLKKYIDKNFIRKFSFPDKISMKKKIYSFNNFDNNKIEMYCQGCGSKVSKKTLIDFLNKNGSSKELPDSAFFKINQKHMIQTIDFIKLFPSFDPYDFGIISYQHSQNDIISSGGSVESLSVSVGVPFSENLVESFYLEFFMRGIKFESDKDRSFLAAGHSYLSNEPGLAITMNGKIIRRLKKSLAKKGDLIYLSKPLGSGYLLAAYYKNSNLIDVKDFEEITKFLKKSNKMAAEVAISNYCQAMTDVSGFGLASHLGDICNSSNLSAEIFLKEKILLVNKKNLLHEFESTGYKNNYNSSSNLIKIDINHPLFKILFDPQTNGPLLMAINQSNKDKFEKEFKKFYKYKPLLIGKFIEKEEKVILVN